MYIITYYYVFCFYTIIKLFRHIDFYYVLLSIRYYIILHRHYYVIIMSLLRHYYVSLH